MSEIMSYSLKYYPDPGIAYDISKMLFVKLNPESVWKECLTSLDSPIDEVEFIRKHVDSFPTPDSTLLIFFFRPTNKNETFFSQIVNSLINQSFKNFSINSLISFLNNDLSIRKNLYHYYFGKQDTSFSDLENDIRVNRTIPDRIKLLLFGFTLNPTKYISILCNTLQDYYARYKTSYFSQVKSINIPECFINELIENTYSSKQMFNLKSQLDSISYSLSFIIPIYLFRNFLVEEPFLITTEYTINNAFTKKNPPYTSALLLKASALDDKFRITIIDQLMHNNCMTLQEISHVIGLSTSTTNHHLTKLKKANMVSSIHTGHSVHYYINTDGIQNTIDLLQIIKKGVIES